MIKMVRFMVLFICVLAININVYAYDNTDIKLAETDIENELISRIESIDVNQMWHVDIMNYTHSIAEEARSYGFSNDNYIIVKAGELWMEAFSKFCYDRDIVATVIYNEAWYQCSNRHRELVGAVIYNRMKSDLFPNTIYEVVVQKGQYRVSYTDPNSYYGQRARENEENWRVCQEIASKVLYGNVACDENVFFQSNFIQGDYIYEIHKTSYSTTYFCSKY